MDKNVQEGNLSEEKKSLPECSLMISEFWQTKYRRDSCKSWNLFYKRNETRFFKDRHWTWQEFPWLLKVSKLTLLEIGCGVGNFVIPLVKERCSSGMETKAWACDFSPKAIELVKCRLDEEDLDIFIHPFVADVTQAGSLDLCPSIDLVTCIFVLSALPPEQLEQALDNIVSKVNGYLIIRDYVKGDAAQFRFKLDRQLGQDLYVRQDGTLARYFDLYELTESIRTRGLYIKESKEIHTRTTNIAMGLDQPRTFLQIIASIKKPLEKV